ncbi:hypothetical protein GLOIN_2v1479732 [Rhizophagus clarus]|uniref:Uncharacterized protein n=2 Tax=Rhizophagus clarus TaxID=94130 RepID=A0A8H3LU89_9GLOM|nr:hypothetical protein GLOIN_2v1479732 [Rhizophagus clarus]
MTFQEYLIGTCLGCKKCLYCGVELIKVAFTRISKPSLPLKQLEYIQESISRFGYSLDPAITFKLTFCPACNSAFQRKKSNTNSKSSTLYAEQEITFNLIIKPFTESALPSKWMEIQVSLLDDILIEVHFYVEKLTGDKDIIHSDYSVSFKSEKATGVGSQLVDLQDYKKFLLDYENLIEKCKNMAIIVSLKKDKKQKRKEVLHSEDSEDENTNLQKRKKKGIPKLDNFSEVLQ